MHVGSRVMQTWPLHVKGRMGTVTEITGVRAGDGSPETVLVDIDEVGVIFLHVDNLEECDPIAWRVAFNNYCDGWEELEIPSDLFFSGELDEVNHWVAQELGADASVTDCVACANGEVMRHAYEAPNA